MASNEPHEGLARLTGEQVSAINRFPDDNPNPVLRVDDDGRLIYANPASAAVLRALGVTVGDRVPRDDGPPRGRRAVERGSMELVVDHRTYEVWPVPIPDLGFTNLYGRDVTAERAIVKFPDQNPNPVFRIHRDGRLLYANPASLGLIAGLGLAVGADLPAGLRDALLERARRAAARDGRGRGRGLRLRAAAGRRPGIRVRQRLRHGRHGGEGARAARPRERAAAAQHPARADRRPAARAASR